MIEDHDREQTLSLISECWISLEKIFKETPRLYEPTFTPKKGRNGKSKPYDPESPIRKFGSEPYLHATLFAEINRRHPNSENFVLGVEGKKLNGKRPDILAWNPKKDWEQENPYFVIELKVVGLALLEGKSLFIKEMKNYSDILENGKTLFFFGCYYEGDPKEIIEIVKEYGSILNKMIQDGGLSPGLKKKSVVEGYAFPGQNEWIIIDNSVI